MDNDWFDFFSARTYVSQLGFPRRMLFHMQNKKFLISSHTVLSMTCLNIVCQELLTACAPYSHTRLNFVSRVVNLCDIRLLWSDCFDCVMARTFLSRNDLGRFYFLHFISEVEVPLWIYGDTLIFVLPRAIQWAKSKWRKKYLVLKTKAMILTSMGMSSLKPNFTASPLASSSCFSPTRATNRKWLMVVTSCFDVALSIFT